MEEFTKRKTPRWQSYDYNDPGAYFITICTESKAKILSKIVGTGVLDCPQVELTSYGKVADKYLNQLNDFYDYIKVDSYVIMPNHIHIMLFIYPHGQSGTPVPTRANSAFLHFISTFKRFCNKEYGHNIWQSRSNDHIIRNREDYEKHLNYIYENPMKWTLDEFYSEE